MRYKNNQIEKLCTDEREMRKQRPDLMKKLPRRIKALEAADTFGDLAEIDPCGRWHKLNRGKENQPDEWASDVSGNWRLIVEPSPSSSLAAVDVTVTDVEDYHKR